MTIKNCMNYNTANFSSLTEYTKKICEDTNTMKSEIQIFSHLVKLEKNLLQFTNACWLSAPA